MSARLCIGLVLVLVPAGCNKHYESDSECEPWTDVPASLGVEPAELLDCGIASIATTEDEFTPMQSCLRTAYDEGQLARLRYVLGTDSTTTVAWYVLPFDHEPRYLEHLQAELQDGAPAEDVSFIKACEAHSPCESGPPRSAVTSGRACARDRHRRPRALVAARE